jgi:hypothetical protein
VAVEEMLSVEQFAAPEPSYSIPIWTVYPPNNSPDAARD